MTPTPGSATPKPRVGESIAGCRHATACGRVKAVAEHVTVDGMNHWWVREDWNDGLVRVRREANGALYEVELVQQTD